MALLTATNLDHAYGTQLVLDAVTLSIEPGEKVGLVGRNGGGKTTLLRILGGQLLPDSGTLQVQRGARVGYLSQDPELEAEDTVRDAAERAFAELHDLHVRLHELFEQMAEASESELDRLLKRQALLESQVEAAGGYAIDHRIDATLHGLSIPDEQFGQKVSSLSGGEKGRVGLARLLLEEPDLLLLDEPTNHLDIDGRQWLENFLANEFAGAVLMVSHDRWLLDRVVDRILEVEQGGLRDYPGNYQKYADLRRERQLTQARVYDKQLDRIRQEEQFIRRYKTGQRAKQARGRQSRLDRYKREKLVERPAELDVMRLKLPNAPRSGEQVIVAERLSKAFGETKIFEEVDLTVMRGECIGVIGPNGAGKTTLVRCLLGELEPDAGLVRQGSRLSVGYYRQSHEHIDLDLTVWQYLQSVIVSLDGQARAPEQQARDLAGAFLFSGDEQDKTLGDLSGGERSRVVLAGLVAGAHNLLVLDEPSNHLDIPSAERLEQALSAVDGYDGSLLLISHDRALLESTCDKLLIFEGGARVRLFPGRYSEWAQRRQRELEDDRAASSASQSTRSARRSDSAGKPSAARKPASEVDAIAKLSLSKLELRIEEIETRIAEIDRLMMDPDVYTDGEQCRTLQQERAQMMQALEPMEFEWSRRAGDE